ncbi:LysR family transcriptional regulator [Saccharopolyspora sp. 5N708]|uniref:LysR family transcriptional regulator n=1 Tax=Saccharopolyspora sp. 5N708 TaxID=3457424 RepID=UPI003FD697EE
MELRHLRYFVSVAEELHFRRAAEKLHIVQPALSKQITALENELGIELLKRDRRHVALTEAGETFLQEAVEILAHTNGAIQRAQAISRGEVGRLNIGFIHPALADLLPRSLRRFRQRYPAVKITLSEATSRAAIEKVASRSMHFAFTRLPVAERPDLLTEPVSEEPVLLVVPCGHPLATAPSVMLGDLADEDLILVARQVEPELHDYYLTTCVNAGFSPRLAQEVNSTSVAIGLAAAGLGITFAPASARITAQRNVVYRDITGPAPKLTMGALYHSGRKPAILANFLALRPWEPEVPGPQGAAGQPPEVGSG